MRLRSDLILREMGAEFVIVDPSQEVVDMSRVFTLNETAALIWKKLEGVEFTIDHVVHIVTNDYDVHPEQALEDAKQLLEQFEKDGLLE